MSQKPDGPEQRPVARVGQGSDPVGNGPAGSAKSSAGTGSSFAASNLGAAWQEPGMQYYGVVCLVALGMILVVFMQMGLGLLSILPVLVGGLGLVTRWGSGPPVLMLSVAASSGYRISQGGKWMSPT